MYILFMPLVFWHWLCEQFNKFFPPSPFLREPPYKFTIKLVDDDEDTEPFENWFDEDIVTENNYLLWKICQFFLILVDMIDVPFSRYSVDMSTIRFRKSDCITIKEGSTKDQVEKIYREIYFTDSIYSTDFFYYYCNYGNVVIHKPTGYIINLLDAPCLFGKYDSMEPLKIYPNIDLD